MLSWVNSVRIELNYRAPRYCPEYHLSLFGTSLPPLPIHIHITHWYQNPIAKMSSLPLLFNMMLEVLANTVSQEKEIKVTFIRTEDIKLSFFLDAMIICIENPKESTNY